MEHQPDKQKDHKLSFLDICCNGEEIMLSALPSQKLQALVVIMCALSGNPAEMESTSAGKTTLDVWFHAGQEAEREIIQEQVIRFNESRKTVEVNLTFIPERDYNAQIQAAAMADDLPDVLEFDGPYLYNYVWQNHLLPLDDYIPQKIKEDLLPSIIAQGTYQGSLYSVATFDSGLGLYVNKDMLEAINARIPTSAGDAWTIDEFNTILTRLSDEDPDGAVLDLKLNYSGEWYSYAFSPVLQSAGADLINRETMFATGVLNSDSAVTALKYIQNWVAQELVDYNTDDAAFTTGRVAISWVGHWEYDRYSKALGEKLAIVPLPDFGSGSKTGQGSWNWGITKACSNPDAAIDFLSFLLETDQVLAMANGNGAVPATKDAIAKSDLYGPDGPLHLFSEQLLEGYSVPRPRTPAYPIISSTFQSSFMKIINKAPIQDTLDRAAKLIDEDIEDTGYKSVIK